MQTNTSSNELLILKTVFNSIDIFTLSFFLIEFTVRLIFCPSKTNFVKNIFNWIDLLSSLAYLILFVLPGNVSPTLKSICRLLRVLLLIKITRFSSGLQIITETIQKSFQELFPLFLYFAIGVVFFSSVIFYCEFEFNSEFTSIPASFWWCVITMTSKLIFIQMNAVCLF